MHAGAGRARARARARTRHSCMHFPSVSLFFQCISSVSILFSLFFQCFSRRLTNAAPEVSGIHKGLNSFQKATNDMKVSDATISMECRPMSLTMCGRRQMSLPTSVGTSPMSVPMSHDVGRLLSTSLPRPAHIGNDVGERVDDIGNDVGARPQYR